MSGGGRKSPMFGCAGTQATPLGDGSGLVGGVSVKSFDLGAIAFFDDAAAEFECGRECAVLDGHLFGEDDGFLQLLELGEVLVDVCDDSVVERLDLGMGDEFGASRALDAVLLAQSSRWAKAGAMTTAGKRRLSPMTAASLMSGLALSEPSMGCGAMNFPPEVLIRSFLRSVMERNPSAVDVADVSGLEPSILEGVGGFGGHVPVAPENRWTVDEDLAVFRDVHFEIGKDFADGAELVCGRIVEGDDGGSFGESVAFVDADADLGVPLAEFAAERSSAGDVDVDTSTHSFADFGIEETVGESPTKICRAFVRRGW